MGSASVAFKDYREMLELRRGLCGEGVIGDLASRPRLCPHREDG
ncbi:MULTISPECIES: hypothetical protein [Moorena]|nr:MULTISPECIES: hypothetical protein [Moorena]